MFSRRSILSQHWLSSATTSPNSDLFLRPRSNNKCNCHCNNCNAAAQPAENKMGKKLESAASEWLGEPWKACFLEKKQSRAENRFWTGSRIPIRSQSLGNLHAHFLSGSCNICVRVINIYVCTRYLSRYWPKASASGMASKQSPTAVSCNLWPFFKFCTRTCNYVAANEANRLPAFVMPQTNRKKKIVKRYLLRSRSLRGCSCTCRKQLLPSGLCKKKRNWSRTDWYFEYFFRENLKAKIAKFPCWWLTVCYFL